MLRYIVSWERLARPFQRILRKRPICNGCGHWGRCALRPRSAGARAGTTHSRCARWARARGVIAAMALETTAEAPVPVRTVLQAVGGWIGRLGRIWVEGQIAECKKRGNTVFVTLRDPLAAVSAQVICSRAVFDVVSPVEGARVVMFVKPDFNATRGSFALTALEIRAVGVGELLARLEGVRGQLAAGGLFSAERKRPLPFPPGVIGLVCGRESA